MSWNGNFAWQIIWLEGILVFCLSITNYHKWRCLEQHTHLLSHSFCGSWVWSWLSWVLCSLSQECKQDVAWAVFSSEGFTEKESISTFIQVVGRIHFLVLRGFGTWFLFGCGLEATNRLWRWPPSVLPCGLLQPGHLLPQASKRNALSSLIQYNVITRVILKKTFKRSSLKKTTGQRFIHWPNWLGLLFLFLF